jgi:hypothetical protein
MFIHFENNLESERNFFLVIILKVIDLING